jgi:TolA-binding protein
MTGEEIERAISFLLDSQAKHDAQIGELRDQVSELTARVAEVNHVITMQSESTSQFNEMITGAITSLIEAQRRTETKVDRLVDVAAQSEARHNETDERLDRLAAMVERLAARE